MGPGGQGRALALGLWIVKLAWFGAARHSPRMTAEPTREQRLAAQLRENLHRRKAQAREIKGAAATPPPIPASTLPKSGPAH